MQLDNLSQRGGGAMTIQTARRSRLRLDRLRRARAGPLDGRQRGIPAVTRASRARLRKTRWSRPVHVAITYDADGTIRVYRDGLPYGEPYKASEAGGFRAGEAVILFGQRHTPAGGNRGLAGTLMRARLYDRALEPGEIAASAASFRDYIPVERDHRGPCRPSGTEERERILAEIERLRTSSAANPRVLRRRAARAGSDARARFEAIRISPERS